MIFRLFCVINMALLLCNLQAMIIDSAPTDAKHGDVDIQDALPIKLYNAYKTRNKSTIKAIAKLYTSEAELVYVVLQSMNHALENYEEKLCLSIFSESSLQKHFNTIHPKSLFFKEIKEQLQTLLSLSIKNHFFGFLQCLLNSEIFCEFIQRNDFFSTKIRKNILNLFLVSAAIDKKISFLKAILHADKFFHFLNIDTQQKFNLVATKAYNFDYIDLIKSKDANHSSENSDSDIETNTSNSSKSSSSTDDTIIMIYCDAGNDEEVTTESSTSGVFEEENTNVGLNTDTTTNVVNNEL